jgi:hypothetical protein
MLQAAIIRQDGPVWALLMSSNTRDVISNGLKATAISVL